MRRFAVIVLALILAGAAGGVGCLAVGAAFAANDAMACCTPRCPAPNGPRPTQSCSAQPCAPSAEVAPASHGAFAASALCGWAVLSVSDAMFAAPLPAVASMAATHVHAPPPSDPAVAIDRLCSRQI
jgi:hypothetical protein